ncbi:hypothetical protein [Kitasatospora sp. NPDC097643]
MNESAAEGSRLVAEGRMTEQDTERFLQLLAGLESSLEADREVAGSDA